MAIMASDGGWPNIPGEMAARVRASDWAATPLGPSAGWPDRLRAIVEHVLASPLVASVALLDARLLIYNDVAAALYGDRHPAALGRPLGETFADSYPAVAALYDRVFAGETVHVATQPLALGTGGTGGAGAVFDAYLNPVRDASGAVIGAAMAGIEIGGRLRDDAALRDSEARFRAFVTASAEIVYRMSPDWSELRQLEGKTFLRDTGAPDADWLDHHVHPDDQAMVRAAIDRAIGTKGIFELEHRVFRADGSVGHMRSRAVPILDARGEISEWLGAASDVTAARALEDARAAAEGAALRAKARYTTLVDAIDQGFCTIELAFDADDRATDYRFLEVGASFEAQTGIADAAGRWMRDIAPDQDQSWFDIYGAVARTGESARFEEYSTPMDRWWDVFAFRIDDPADRQVAVLFRDISDRKRAELALHDSENRLRTLFESTDQGFMEVEVVMDADARIVDWRYVALNPAFERLTGLTDMTGRLVSEIVPGLKPEWAERYAHVVNTGESISFEQPAAGLERWFRVHLARIGDAGSRRVAAVYDDVTERKRMEAALRDGQERQAFLLKLSDALRPLDDPLEIQRIAARLLGKQLGANQVHYGEVLADTGDVSTIVVRQGYGDGLPPVQGTFHYGVEGWRERLLATYRAGRTAVSRDVEADPAIGAAEAAVMTGAGFHAYVAVPLRKADAWVAVLTVQSIAPRNWLPAEIALIEDVAERTWAAVERARADAARQESEMRLQQFGEASQDVLWTRDAKTLQWEYLTPAFETLYGLKRETAAQGDNMAGWLDLIVPEDRERAEQSVKRVHDGNWVTFDFRIRRPSDGSIRWMRNTDFPIQDASGKVVRIGGIGHDVTELKRAEAATAESENRLRTLMEGIPQLVWRSCDRGMWTWASPQWLAFTGQRQEETHGLGWLDAVHPDDHATTMRAWEAAKPHGMLDVEYRVRRVADGAWLWHHTRSLPVRGADDRILEWLGTSTDIQDLREMQERQHVLVTELQHRTFNLISVVRSMADATLRSSASLDEFKPRFRDRIDALARVQRLLSRLKEGDRITFDELIRAELSAAGALPRDDGRVTLDGPDGVMLRSATVQTFAMALHELTTNALKYGALKQPSAHLDVRWRVAADDRGQPWLNVDWCESGVAMPFSSATPAGTGQGRTLIEQALPYQLHARTTYILADDGVRCSIALPVSQHVEAGKVQFDA